MKDLIKVIILLSFGTMIYGGLMGYELFPDYAFIVFILSTIIFAVVNNQNKS